MIISDKRLRRIIVEEITSAFTGPISGDEIIVSDDENCFFGSRNRRIPSGRLRTTRAGRGLALDTVMSAIMDHPDLSGMSASDLDWDIVDEDWEDDLSSVTVLGRGCKDSRLAEPGRSQSTEDQPLDTGEVESDESSDDYLDPVGDADAGQEDLESELPQPEFDSGTVETETLLIISGDNRTLDLSGIDMGILSNKNVTFGGQEYEVRLARERRGQPGRSYRFNVSEAALLDEDSVTIEGSVSVGLGSIPMTSSLSFEDMEPYTSEIESGEETITIGPMRNEEGESGYVILVKQ